MEIVRQRKKRLLAWILTLVLCVGLWQESVQASDVTEEPGFGEVNTETTGSEEGTKKKYNVTISLVYKNSESLGEIQADGGCTGNFGTHFLEWTENDSGNVQIFLEDADPKAVAGGAFKSSNSEISHPLLGWYDKNGDNFNTFVSDLTLNMIDEKFVSKSSIDEAANVETIGYDVYAVLGKSIEISFWDGINGSGYGEGNDVGVKNICKVQKSITESSCTFDLPNVGNEQGYVTEWAIVEFGEEGSIIKKTIGPPGKNHEVNYDDNFEGEYQIIANKYSKEISQGGNYVLCPGTEYILTSKGWKVNNGEDGYTYGNDNGIVFYVQSKEEYSFGK